MQISLISNRLLNNFVKILPESHEENKIGSRYQPSQISIIYNFKYRALSLFLFRLFLMQN